MTSDGKATSGDGHVTSGQERRPSEQGHPASGRGHPSSGHGHPASGETRVTSGEWRARTRESFADLAATIRARPPRLGATRLVAIDGPSGGGKTRFADRLAETLGAPVVHTDDLLDGWDDQFTFWDRLEAQVLAPLRRGETARYRRYLWHRGEFGGVPVLIEPAPVVLMEGVSSARRVIRSELSLAVFVCAPPDLRLRRALARDGGDGVAFRAYLERWRRREDEHFVIEGTADYADVLVDGATGDETAQDANGEGRDGGGRDGGGQDGEGRDGGGQDGEGRDGGGRDGEGR
ncbi:MAG TPA: hypothetical protein VFR35_11645, partial [Actinoplanes sp.]|nr:hypothetical protein [Actinoplanes sp.]